MCIYIVYVIVSKGIIDLHGGTLSVYSDGEGRGSTFTIILPMQSNSHHPIYSSSSNDVEESIRSEVGGALVKPILRRGNSDVMISDQIIKRKTSSSVAPEIVSNNQINQNITATYSISTMISHIWNYKIPFWCNRHEKEKTGNHSTVKQDIPEDELPVTPTQGLPMGHHSWSATTKVMNVDDGEIKLDTPVPVPKRALIGDDVAMNRKMIRRAFDGLYECSEAVDGKQALDLVKEASANSDVSYYDVITMDFQMPVMDGITATREIRGLGYIGVIVGVTGNALQDDIDAFIRNGANAVLKKPITAKELRAYLMTTNN